MNKIFLVFLSITLINTMTMLSNRNNNQNIELENEINEEMPEEEAATEEATTEEAVEESTEDSNNTTVGTIEDEEEKETDELEDVEEESEELFPDIDIELTDEEKALVFKYIGKIDINYLMNLTSDGITDEENILIIDHLKDRLTEEEFKEVEDLIIRFLYTLQ
ncbi:MAG: hypothetical protein R6U59_06300 [Eubacteriales bacterium]